MPHPFRFAVQSYDASSGAEWRETARSTEAMGYSCLHLADHYIGPGPMLEKTNHPVQSIAAVPAMMMAAEATSTIKVGCRVFCIDYRPAAVLAKEAATIDLLSDGRLEMGIGAGWLGGEYEAMGLTMDPAGQRITRMEEYIRVIKAHFSGEPIEVLGEQIEVRGFTGVPARDPAPALMIGGGAKRVLGIAGREADIVSFNFDNSSGKIGPGVPTSTAEHMANKLDWVRAGAGDRYDDIELELGAYFTVVTDDAAKTAAGMAQMFGLEPEQMMEHPHALIGTVDAICDELVKRREEWGVSYWTVGARNAPAFAPVVERLAGT
ncbi:MAG: TIGR03621 family F420-dependent LLM class oxidoreductase [Actinomycetota bacterium]